MAISVYNATITGREDLTGALAFFRVRSDDDPARAFAPGQYFTLGLLADRALVRRPYSVASSPARLRDDYEFYIRLIPGGALTPRLFAARAGDRVSLTGPKGRFTLLPDDQRLHLFVATGCGIAPFISMIRGFRDAAQPRRAVLIHGVSYARELAYRPFLRDWSADARNGFAYIPTVSRPAAPENGSWTGSTGRAERILPRVCETYGITPQNAVAYVCGNPEMTLEARTILRTRGFADRDIRLEEYWPLKR